jgi:hypothetical protein
LMVCLRFDDMLADEGEVIAHEHLATERNADWERLVVAVAQPH